MATNDASYMVSQIKSNGLVVLENVFNEEYCDKYKKILDDILSSRIDSDSFCGNNVKIITVTGSATKYWQIKSWDRFMLPKPFGKIQIVVSSLLDIAEKPSTSEEEVQLLTNFINHYQDEADRLTGKIS